MSDDKLKPCPFCGHDAKFFRCGHLKVRLPDCVSCSNDDCPATTLECTREEWNARPRESSFLKVVEEMEKALRSYKWESELNMYVCSDIGKVGSALAFLNKWREENK